MIDAELFLKVKNIMAQVIDEAIADGVELTPSEAFKIAVQRFEDENS